MPRPSIRKAIYAVSVAAVPLLIVLGVEANAAAAYVAAGLAVANLALAFANVPNDPDE
jgi:hypothetical protein